MMNKRAPGSQDEERGQQLRAELPRYAAPERLGAAIVEAATPAPRRRSAWLAPAFAAAATALVLVLAFVPLLPRILPADPAQRLMRSVVAEHERALMWGARRPEAIPTALPWLTQESGIGLTRVFGGDDRLAFRGAEPVYRADRGGSGGRVRGGGGGDTSSTTPCPLLREPLKSCLSKCTFGCAFLRRVR